MIEMTNDQVVTLNEEIKKAETILEKMKNNINIAPNEELKQMAIKNVEIFSKHLEFMKNMKDKNNG